MLLWNVGEMGVGGEGKGGERSGEGESVSWVVGKGGGVMLYFSPNRGKIFFFFEMKEIFSHYPSLHEYFFITNAGWV